MAGVGRSRAGTSKKVRGMWASKHILVKFSGNKK